MPELPEVETVVRGLRSRILGKQFDAIFHQSRFIREANPVGWEEQLRGHRVESVARRGKYIIIHLNHNAALVVHLRMTGRLWIKPGSYAPDLHDRFVVGLGGERLVLSDARQFARVHWRPDGALETDPGLARLGTDALIITKVEFESLCRAGNRPIKSLLLDQTRLSGIGNIYADESLHVASIRPTVRASRLNRKQITALHAAFRAVLRRAIRSCGTTFDTFSDLEGQRGGYGPRLKVYGRDGLPCSKCGHTIRRVVVAGRGTHFCPQCQKR